MPSGLIPNRFVAPSGVENIIGSPERPALFTNLASWPDRSSDLLGREKLLGAIQKRETLPTGSRHIFNSVQGEATGRCTRVLTRGSVSY